MNNKIIVLMAILPLLLTAVGGTVFAETPSQVQEGSVGNYSFGYNATSSTVINLSYQSEVSDSVQNTVIANSVTAENGTSLAPGSKLMVPMTMDSIALSNATILHSSSEDVFLMVSNYHGAWLNYSLASAPQQVNLNLQSQMNLMLYKLGLSSGSTEPSYWVYSVIVNEMQFYLFSNSPGSVSGDNISLHSSGYVLTGIITFSALSKAVGDMNNVRETFFSYNNTTGNVTGKYLSFNFNSTSGMFSSFARNETLPTTASNNEIFSEFYATGNGNLTSSSNFPAIPISTPTVYGSLFVYANNTSIFAIHNNPSLQTNMVIDNGTLHFLLAPGLTAKVISTEGNDSSVESDQVYGTPSDAAGSYLGMNGEIQAGQRAIAIYGNGMTAYLLLHGGYASVNGSNVTINTTRAALVTFVSPPGLQYAYLRSAEMRAIESAIEHGKIAAVVSITGPGGANASVLINFNTTVQTSVTDVTSGKAVVALSSIADHHQGTNVLIFVSNSVITNTSSIKVTFDGTSISLTSVDGVLNTTSSTSAYFAQLKVPGGMLIVLHVPHFSNHTLEITSAQAQSPLLTHSGKLLALGGVIAAIAIIVAVVAMSRKKTQ